MGMNMAVGEYIYAHLRTAEKWINRQGRRPGWGRGKYLRRWISGISSWEEMERSIDIRSVAIVALLQFEVKKFLNPVNIE